MSFHQVLLLGQYSTGKTTFIKHLLQRDYPGCHIGPEPTTDRFVIVNHAMEERITPGNTLCVMPDKPYTGLTAFGTGFLSKFQSSSCPARLLEEITIVDTPGVLSGEKQRIERSYNFIEARGSRPAAPALLQLRGGFFPCCVSAARARATVRPWRSVCCAAAVLSPGGGRGGRTAVGLCAEPGHWWGFQRPFRLLAPRFIARFCSPCRLLRHANRRCVSGSRRAAT